MENATTEIFNKAMENSIVVDFLSSIAGVFYDEGMIQRKDVDNFRLVLSGISSSTHRTQPIIGQLLEQHCEFIDFLIYRFGCHNLSHNLVCYAIRGQIKDLEEELAQFAKVLLKKSDLFLNRTFRLYNEHSYVGDCLYSTYIIHFCNAIRTVTNQLASVKQNLSYIKGHGFDQGTERDQLVDQNIAKALGFLGVTPEIYSIFDKPWWLKDLATTLENFSTLTSTFYAQVTKNSGKPEQFYRSTACDSLLLECRKLSLLNPPTLNRPQHALVEADNFRRQLSSVLQSIIATSKLWLPQISTCLKATEIDLSAPSISEACQNRFIFELLQKGVPPKTAKDVLTKLLAYLARHHLKPSEILPGELTKINPVLEPQLLECLSTLENSNTSIMFGSQEKANTLKMSHELKNFFERTLSQSTTMIAVLIITLSQFACGIKTPPMSDVVAIRPDVPFKPLKKISTKIPTLKVPSEKKPISAPQKP